MNLKLVADHRGGSLAIGHHPLDAGGNVTLLKSTAIVVNDIQVQLVGIHNAVVRDGIALTVEQDVGLGMIGRVR